MWPEVIVEACLFHWKQALRRQLSEKSCLTIYNKSIKMQEAVALFKSLAFVPEDEVIEVFEECVEPAMSKMTSDPDCLPEVERYFDYLEKSYIGSFGRNGKRKNPLYPPKLWNKFDVALAGTVKTSNACENWHSQIESACQTSSVWKFFKFLKQEDALMETRCDQNIIGIRHQTPPWTP